MFDKIALIIISIFVPIVVFTGIKIYNSKVNKKLLVALVLTFLGLELFRFFYNARFYENAFTPSTALTFCFLSFLCVGSLFAIFKKGKIGDLAKYFVCLTALAPIIMALFDSRLFVFPNDTYAVVKALYFLECGFGLTISILLAKFFNLKFTKSIWQVAIMFLVYVLINIYANEYWKVGVEYNFAYYAKMIFSLLSTGVMALVYNTFVYKKEDIK